jgi:hypothetical protein
MSSVAVMQIPAATAMLSNLVLRLLVFKRV